MNIFYSSLTSVLLLTSSLLCLPICQTVFSQEDLSPGPAPLKETSVIPSNSSALTSSLSNQQTASVQDAILYHSGEMRVDQEKQARQERIHNVHLVQEAWKKAGNGAGIYHVSYSQTEIIKLRLREFMQTTVVLPSWEIIEDILVGDESAFEAQKTNNHILTLKCAEFIGSDTNITVVGQSGNVYTFFVESEGYNDGRVPHVRVHVHVAGGIPSHMVAAAQAEEKKQQAGLQQNGDTETLDNGYPAQVKPRIETMNFKWMMSGDRSFGIKQVFSDGLRTWFVFDHKLSDQDLPAVWMIRDGVDTHANNRFDDKTDTLIVDGVGPFTLINGDKTVCAWLKHDKQGA